MAESFVTLEMKHGDEEEEEVLRVYQVMAYGLFYSIYRLYYEQNSKALALLLTSLEPAFEVLRFGVFLAHLQESLPIKSGRNESQ